MKIRRLGAQLFHANGRTDGQTGRHDEANIVAFDYIANAPKTGLLDNDKLMKWKL
jgi:hypothetical protein